MSVGENIKKFRKQKGFTQKELAEKIGVSVQAVSKWECGSTPDISQIIPLANALDISANELLGYMDTYDKMNREWTRILREFGEGSREIIEFEKEVLIAYPNDETFMFRLACDLQHRSELVSDKKESVQYLEMAKRQYRENLRRNPEFDLNRHGLVDVYMRLGQREEALKCAFESKDKDLLLKMIYKGKELDRHRQMLMDRYFGNFIKETLAYKNVEVWKSVKNIIYAAFPDGNYQRYERFLNMLDFRIAKYCEENGDFDGAVEVFEDAVRRCKVENVKTDRFTTPLFDLLPTDREFYEFENETKIMMIDKNMSNAEWLHRVMTGEYWELAEKSKLNEREDYKKLIDELEELIRKQKK